MIPVLPAMLLALGALLSPAQAPSPSPESDLASPQLRIEWLEFKKLYDAKQIEVIDVRGPDAFALGHIPGSRSIPLDDVEKRIDELKKLGKPIVAYCA
jgi:3-mercaptopyruvate sulfurtransferase SseA